MCNIGCVDLIFHGAGHFCSPLQLTRINLLGSPCPHPPKSGLKFIVKILIFHYLRQMPESSFLPEMALCQCLATFPLCDLHVVTSVAAAIVQHFCKKKSQFSTCKGEAAQL